MPDIQPSPDGNGEGRAPATSFFTVVARSWRWYRSNSGPLIRLFAFVGVMNLIAQAPLFAFDDPPFALGFTLGVLFPAVTYGYAYAVASYLLQKDAEDDPLMASTAARETRPTSRHIVNTAVIGSALTALNPLGPVLPAVFYGPPILIQIIAIENRDLKAGWSRMKDVLAGNWGRVVLFLVSMSLALGALLQTIFGLLFVGIDHLSDDQQSAVLLVALSAFMTFALPYLAAAQFELFDDARNGPSNSSSSS